MIRIEDTFQPHDQDTIVIGCSTGPDSMALVDLLLNVREKYNLRLIIAHVNHNIREQSKEEAVFLEKYCRENHLIFESMVIENYGDDNFHNEARNIRYHFFDNVVKKYHANYLLTAHHGDDLVETVLMRIVRGSNLKGYSGFRVRFEMPGYTVVRPLIRYTKKDLEEYDKENHVSFYIDDSNEKDYYTRNRYRKNVLPFLKEEDKNVHLKFLKYSNTLIEASEYLDKVRSNALKRVMNEDKIVINKFLEEDIFIQKDILYSLLDDFYQDDLILLNDKHIELILKLIHSKKGNSFVNLPNDIIVKKEYNTVFFTREMEEITSYEIEFDQYVELPDHHVIEKIDECSNNSNYICRLDSSEIVLPLVVRTRRVGDKMKVKGLNGSQKVKDIFIDRKISKSNRDSWPIVVDSIGNIVWIPGIKKSKFDKKMQDYYDIILKYS